MKKRNPSTFAHKLIIYLLPALVIIFFIIFITVFLFSYKFTRGNARLQASAISRNIYRGLDRRISEIELIPQTVFHLYEPLNEKNIPIFPQKILTSYPLLTDCFVHYDTSNAAHVRSIHAYRPTGSTIRCITTDRILFPDTSNIFRRSAFNGFWTQKKTDTDSLIGCYCEPIYDENNYQHGILEIDFSISSITKFTHDIKLFDSGYVFLTDANGHFIDHPDPRILTSHDLKKHLQTIGIKDSGIVRKMLKGESGYGKIYKGDIPYYIYYAPLPKFDWRIGLLCPYEEILVFPDKFYIFVFSFLLGSLFILFWYTIRVVRKLSDPLKTFSTNIRKIADGEIDAELSPVSSNDEIQELHDVFKYMQTSITSNIEKLNITIAEKEKIVSELKLAQRLQRRFLPKPMQLPETIELWGELKQSKSVGGDFFDYFLINEELYFTIGDVSGKGIPAALYMASIVKLFRYVASRQNSTAEICSIINNYMCDDSDDDMYVTMFIGILNIHSGKMKYTNAGHPEPLLIEDNHSIHILPNSSDAPIGILENIKYNENLYTLNPRCQILLYTDGITDAENSRGQFYGKRNLIESIQDSFNKTPQSIVKDILNEMHTHMEDANQSDDFTILSILYKGKTE